MKQIHFGRKSTAEGRNGWMKCTGIELFKTYAQDDIWLIPINTNGLGRGHIGFPIESASSLIRAIAEAAGDYNYIHDVAMVTAIITEHRFDEMYKLCEGSIETYSTISEWAQEFCTRWNDINIDWSQLGDGEENKKHGFPKEVGCWDEAVLWYAQQKINERK